VRHLTEVLIYGLNTNYVTLVKKSALSAVTEGSLLLYKIKNSKVIGKYKELQETIADISPGKNNTDLKNHNASFLFTRINKEKNPNCHISACHKLNEILRETTSTGRKHFQILQRLQRDQGKWLTSHRNIMHAMNESNVTRSSSKCGS